MNTMTRSLRRHAGSTALLRTAACTMLASATPAFAQRAGTEIVNVASVQADTEGGRVQIASNASAFRIAERLDIVLAPPTSYLAAMAGQPAAAAFTLTNAGNGNERFLLSATLEGATGTIRGFALDSNGDGLFQPGELVLDAATSPILAPGQTIALLALFDADSVPESAALLVFSRAATGSGAPGRVFPARGDAGVDAVVGATGAEAQIRFILSSEPPAQASLVKTQIVSAPDGSTANMRGATVTYTLTARVAAGGTARAASVVDPIPAGTAYLPGSLTLDGLALSDADDADAGTFDGRQVAVALGDIAAQQSRTVQFKVTIQ